MTLYLSTAFSIRSFSGFVCFFGFCLFFKRKTQPKHTLPNTIPQELPSPTHVRPFYGRHDGFEEKHGVQ